MIKFGISIFSKENKLFFLKKIEIPQKIGVAKLALTVPSPMRKVSNLF